MPRKTGVTPGDLRIAVNNRKRINPHATTMVDHPAVTRGPPDGSKRLGHTCSRKETTGGTDGRFPPMSAQLERLYSTTGRRSIPPEQLLRALLLQVLYTIRSERLLMEELNYVAP